MFNTNIRTGSITEFMYKVYAWMTGGLVLSGATAWFVYTTPALFMPLVMNRIALYAILFTKLGLVMYLSTAFKRISYQAAAGIFIAYSVLLGVSLSVIFAVYTMSSIGMVFGITAGMFGTMALYGYVTKADLSSIGNLFGMALWGLIIAMVVNMFMASEGFSYLISFVAVILFTGLTAYDVQKIKMLGYEYAGTSEEKKVALLGALTLYLDFVNLFLHLLRLLGKRR